MSIFKLTQLALFEHLNNTPEDIDDDFIVLMLKELKIDVEEIKKSINNINFYYLYILEENTTNKKLLMRFIGVLFPEFKDEYEKIKKYGNSKINNSYRFIPDKEKSNGFNIIPAEYISENDKFPIIEIKNKEDLCRSLRFELILNPAEKAIVAEVEENWRDNKFEFDFRMFSLVYDIRVEGKNIKKLSLNYEEDTGSLLSLFTRYVSHMANFEKYSEEQWKLTKFENCMNCLFMSRSMIAMFRYSLLLIVNEDARDLKIRYKVIKFRSDIEKMILENIGKNSEEVDNWLLMK